MVAINVEAPLLVDSSDDEKPVMTSCIKAEPAVVEDTNEAEHAVEDMKEVNCAHDDDDDNSTPAATVGFEATMLKDFQSKFGAVVKDVEAKLAPAEQQLKQSADTGEDFSMQGALGSRLKRNKAAYDEYRKLPTGAGVNELRKQFRLKWAKKEWSRVRAEKLRIERHTELEAEIGTWLPVPRVVKEEGGYKSPAAVKAAMNYVRKAVAMGPAWAQVNPMTEAIEVYYIRREKRTEHEKTQVMKDTYADAPAEQRAVETPAPKAAATGAPKAKAARPSADIEPTQGTPTKKTKTASDKKATEQVRAATTMKQKWSKIMQEASTVRSLIDSQDANWSLVSEKITAKLASAVVDVNAHVHQNSFAHALFLGDARSLRKADSKFAQNCEVVCNGIEPLLQKVERFTKILRDQHASIADSA